MIKNEKFNKNIKKINGYSGVNKMRTAIESINKKLDKAKRSVRLETGTLKIFYQKNNEKN